VDEDPNEIWLEPPPEVIVGKMIAVSEETWKRLQERADRAEAERDSLQAMWNTLADAAKEVLGANQPSRFAGRIPLETLVKLEHAVYSEHLDTIAPARKELERLRAVRAAAEAADKVLAGLEQANEDIIDEDNPPLLPGHWLEDIDAARVELRRALDAAKDRPMTTVASREAKRLGDEGT